MEMRNLYEDLGVAPTATAQEIRRAFRRIAATEHPDARQGRGLPPESEAFLYAVLAHEVLIDPEKRASYDAMRRESSEQGTFDQAAFKDLLIHTMQNLGPEFAALRAAALAKNWLDLALTTGSIGVSLWGMAMGARSLVKRLTREEPPAKPKPTIKALAQKRGKR